MKKSQMRSYYSGQAVLLQSSVHIFQRGSAFTSLTARIGCVALALAEKVVNPVVNSIGEEMFMEKLPELMDVAKMKMSSKRVLKSAVTKTAKNKTPFSLVCTKK